MMKVLMINVVCGIRSTGRICIELAKGLEQDGHEVKIAYGREHVPSEYEKYAVKIGKSLDQKLHGIQTRLWDWHGFGSKKATEQFLRWAEQYQPDLLWLHNIHGYYINVEMLFTWIKKHPEMQVKWTLHDCWAFTGHCTHFTMASCGQWRDGCRKCAQKGRYPSSLWKDNCKENYRRKKAAFTGVKDMTLITPSRWLADLVKESYLGEYPVEVQYNTVDITVFKPTSSDFRKKYKLEDKEMILGVASIWDESKGLYDFIRLTGMLNASYAIVLVGLSDKQLKEVPQMIEKVRLPDKKPEDKILEKNVKTNNGIAIHADVRDLYYTITGTAYTGLEQPCHAQLLCLPRTNDTFELAKIYTAADVFVNPTYEDNYPTVNLEAIACGTYVITYLTGGSPETLKWRDNSCEE